jgi:hypothetical protein
MQNLRLFLTFIVITLVVFGCSQNNSPADPMPSASEPEVLAKGDTNLISVKNRIKASEGGSVKMEGTYMGKSGKEVYYNLSIYFKAGALQRDKDISITIDKRLFEYNAQVQFGPHGLVFNTPGTLLIYANGVQLAQENSSLCLMYWTNNSWQKMPGSWGGYLNNYGGNVIAGASIPHFSMYAFGR